MPEAAPEIARCILYCWLKDRGSEFLPGIDRVSADAATQLAHQVPRVFPHFTKHDIGHSARVLDYMAALINDINALNELDVALLVHAAVLHDVGMALGDTELDQLKRDEFVECPIKFAAMLKLRDGDEDLALQELIRRQHADFSAHKVLSEFAPQLVVPELETVSLAEDLAAICRSHTRDVRWIAENLDGQNMKGRYLYNPRFVSHVLRIADLLDFDSRRTPLCLYHLLSPSGRSNDEWQQHFVVTNTEKIRQDKTSSQKRIVLYGNCESPSLHRKVLSYINWIDAELSAAIEASENMVPQYRLVLKDRVERRIRAVGYTISDYRVTVDFKSMTTLLMGEHIYGDTRFGLRELVQNAIDSCRVRSEIESNAHKLGDPVYQPRIQVIVDDDAGSVSVRDNGCGMTEGTIRDYFLNIGRSYYASDDFLLQDLGYVPIGAFGIGFLACFMLSDEVTVRTRHFATGTRCDISFARGSEYISFTRTPDTVFPGTEVALIYSAFMNIFDGKVKSIVEFLTGQLLTEGICVEVVDRDTGTTHAVTKELSALAHPGKGQVALDLTPHLTGVRGSAIVRRTGSCVRTITELDVDGDQLVLWDGSELRKIDDMVLSDIVENETLKYYSLDVIDECEKRDFDILKERFVDIDEIVDKFDRVANITVLLLPDSQWAVDSRETDNDPDFQVVDDLTIRSVLEELDLSGFVPRLCEVTCAFVQRPDLDLLLPYSTPQDRIIRRKSWPWVTSASAEIFVRGILVGKAALPRLPLPAFCDLKTVAVDVTRRDVLPDLSRHSFDDHTSGRLSYVIHRGLMSAWYERMAADDSEKHLLDTFLERFYGKTDQMLRNGRAEPSVRSDA